MHYEVRMSYTLKTKLNTIACQTQWCAQVCDGIIFDIYLELPHTLLKFVLGFHTQKMGECIHVAVPDKTRILFHRIF